VVDELIRQLGAEQTPCIRAFNKCDQYAGILPHGEDIVCISAKSGEGADALVEKLSELLDRGRKRVTLKIPYSKAGTVDALNRDAAVLSTEYTDECIAAEVVLPRDMLRKYAEFIPGYEEPKEDFDK
jgi:GTP-binding protein HflX